MGCITKKWVSLKKRYSKKKPAEEKQDAEGQALTWNPTPAVREETLKGWVKAYPIMNESSHFGCILDPRTGTIRWIERGEEEEEEDDDDDEMEEKTDGEEMHTQNYGKKHD